MKTTKFKGKKIASLALSTCLGLTAMGLSGATYAEQVAIPLGQQGKAWNVKTPTTGATMDQVEQRYGAPLSTTGPVGEPPIYTWDYDNFLVYFEDDRVIHSVVKYQPKDE